MRIIPTRIHAMVDYPTGLLFILAPYLFGFADGTAAQYVPQAVGVVILLQSLITRYELSVAKVVPMPVHLMMDIAGGVFLAASPFLFGFSDRVMWPHVILGAAEAGIALMTRSTPALETARARA